MNYLEQFATYLRSERGLSENTVSNYLMDVGQFLGWLKKPVTRVTRDDVQQFLLWIMQHGSSPRTAGRKLETVRQFYRLLLSDDAIQANPTRGIPYPKLTKALPKLLTESEVNKLVRWSGSRQRGPCAPRDRAIMLTLYASGLRESELVNLKLSDVDLDAGCLKVWDGKGGKDGIAPLSPPAIRAVKHYVRVLRPKLASDSPYLFLTRTGQQFTRQRIWQIVSEAGQAVLGRAVSPHHFRHGCATALIQGGADIRDVQAVLRHSSINTTQIYVHTDMTYLRRIHNESHPRS